MADETTPAAAGGLDSKIAALTAKIERESRFTRSLVVICTAAILGVSLVPVKIMLTDLPTIIWAEFSEHLDTIHGQWMLLDKNFDQGKPIPAPDKPAGTPTPAGDAAK